MDELQIRPLQSLDIPAGLALCRASGWNQLAGDWQMLIEYEPQGCFAAIAGESLVATVTTTRFGRELAWIGMMLVDERFRRRGIGRTLMTTAMNYLQQQGVRCIKLDATPVGRLVYEQLGFAPEFDFQRWERGGAEEAEADCSAAAGTLAASMQQLDRRAFGADRWPVLQRMAARSRVISGQDGFGMRRAGHLAAYLGPVVASNGAEAEAIVHELAPIGKERLFWDVPSRNPKAMELAQQLGFSPTRTLTRMWLGERCVADDPALIYAFADPSHG